MEWTPDTGTRSRRSSWVTTAFLQQRKAAREAGRAAHEAKRAFNNGKRAGLIPAELRPLKTKATETAKAAKTAHKQLAKGAYVTKRGPQFAVFRSNKPARAVSIHDTLDEAQEAAEAL